MRLLNVMLSRIGREASDQWGILKYFPQSRCVFISHWSREKKQKSIVIKIEGAIWFGLKKIVIISRELLVSLRTWLNDLRTRGISLKRPQFPILMAAFSYCKAFDLRRAPFSLCSHTVHASSSARVTFWLGLNNRCGLLTKPGNAMVDKKQSVKTY